VTPVEDPKEEEDDGRQIEEPNVGADHRPRQSLSNHQAPEVISFAVSHLEGDLTFGEDFDGVLVAQRRDPALHLPMMPAVTALFAVGVEAIAEFLLENGPGGRPQLDWARLELILDIALFREAFSAMSATHGVFGELVGMR
jgi:hypothetical protein